MAVSNRAFITGCDSKTEWMLPWFVKNYKKHNTTPIFFCDFGISSEYKTFVDSFFDEVIPVKKNYPPQVKLGWFKKPNALLQAEALVEDRVWIDTDCEILGNIDGIWKYVMKDSISLSVDRPWTEMREGTWYNTGVVGVSGIPSILRDWETRCFKGDMAPSNPNLPPQGDQDVLHKMIHDDPIRWTGRIVELPNRYNYLRLQIDRGFDDPKKLIVHWTGHKGKVIIRNKIK